MKSGANQVGLLVSLDERCSQERNRTSDRKDSNLTIMRALSPRPAAVSAFLPMLVLGLGVGQSARCYAQTQAGVPAKVAVLREPLPSDKGTTNCAAPAAARPAAKPEPEVSLDIAKELAVMKARIEQLETELKSRNAAEPAPVPATAPATRVTDTAPIAAPANPAAPVGQQAAAPAREARAGGSVCLRRLDMAERQSAQQRCGMGLKVLHSRRSAWTSIT